MDDTSSMLQRHSFQRRHIGAGEWMFAAYATLIIGPMLCGALGVERWYAIALVFALAFLIAVAIARVIAELDGVMRHRNRLSSDDT